MSHPGTEPELGVARGTRADVGSAGARPCVAQGGLACVCVCMCVHTGRAQELHCAPCHGNGELRRDQRCPGLCVAAHLGVTLPPRGRWRGGSRGCVELLDAQDLPGEGSACLAWSRGAGLSRGIVGHLLWAVVPAQPWILPFGVQSPALAGPSSSACVQHPSGAVYKGGSPTHASANAAHTPGSLRVAPYFQGPHPAACP